MNDQRLERALRAGPPFASSYIAAPLVLSPARPVRSIALARAAVYSAGALLFAALVAFGQRLPGPGPATTPAPASLEQLNGPILADPLVVSVELRSAIDVACRSWPDFPPEARLVLLDARGGGVAWAWYEKSNGDLLDCPIIDLAPPTRSASGSVLAQDSGSPPPLTLVWSDVQFTSAVGRVGPGLAQVRLEVRDGPSLNATVTDGWFGAYWAPPLQGCPIVDGEHACPEIHVRALAIDANGVVVSSTDFDLPDEQR